MSSSGNNRTNVQSDGVVFVNDVSSRGINQASKTLMSQLVDSSRSSKVKELPDGSRGALGYKSGSFQGDPQTFSQSWTSSAPSGTHDNLKNFLVGCHNVGPFERSYGNQLIVDDMGTMGGGGTKTNEPIKINRILEPRAYGLDYRNNIESVIPYKSLVWRFVQDDDIERSTTVMHTLQQINRFFRSNNSKNKSPTFCDGARFADQWVFSGSPDEHKCDNSMVSNGAITTTTVEQGPVLIKNIFGATGYALSCGFRLYVLLRKICHPTKDVVKDAYRVDNRNTFEDTSYIGDDEGAYWQLVPYACQDDQEPPSNLYNGPGWSGTYYYIGRVMHDDLAKIDPQQSKYNVLTVIHPKKSSTIAESVANFHKLHDLHIAIGV